MQTNPLTDHRQIIKEKLFEKIYLTAAKIDVKYGSAGKKKAKYTYGRIREFWNFEESCPPIYTFIHLKAPIVKWYIHEKLESKENIWNSDFINGLACHGKLTFSKRQYPSFGWHCNNGITNIIRSSEFGGKIGLYRGKHGKWSQVPAFYLKYSKDTVSYVAGLMAGAKVWKYKGVYYARFRGKMKKVIEALKIPIEHFNENQSYFLISPIWPALLTPKMPEVARSQWFNLENACNANIYAPILWRTYVNKSIKTKGIPYLRSERSIFHDFNCEEGAFTKIAKLRVEKDLTELDNRIIEMVKLWSKK